MSTVIERIGIAVGVDGSPGSAAAVRWAAHDAALRHVPLTLVHVADSVVPMWSRTPMPSGFGRWQQQRGRQLIDDAIRIVEDTTSGTGSVQVRSEMYYSATVPTLVDISKESDLVVVGSRGQSPFGRLLGSVSWGLVHHAYCPVAVIHHLQDSSIPAPQAPVLVGVDGSPASESAIAIAFDEASRRHADLIALHAWSDTGVSDFPGVEWPAMKSSEEQVLAERLGGWQERYPDVRVHRVVECDRPAHKLVEHSEHTQLVVVGSHGRGGFAGMLLGSVSAAVINSVQVPVIVACAM
ncbi:MAG TPA: universal stress protein [Mycobacterium sp.]